MKKIVFVSLILLFTAGCLLTNGCSVGASLGRQGCRGGLSAGAGAGINIPPPEIGGPAVENSAEEVYNELMGDEM